MNPKRYFKSPKKTYVSRKISLITSISFAFFNILPIPSFCYNSPKIFSSPVLRVANESINYLDTDPYNTKSIKVSENWSKKLKFMDPFDLGNYFLNSYETIKRIEQDKGIDLSKRRNELHTLILDCIDNLIYKKDFNRAHSLIIRVLFNYPKNKIIEDRFNLTAGYMYFLFGKELEEKKEYDSSRIAYVYSSLHFGRTDAKDLRKQALEEFEKVIELQKMNKINTP